MGLKCQEQLRVFALEHYQGSSYYTCGVYGVLAGDKDGKHCNSSWVQVHELVCSAEKEGWKVDRTSAAQNGGSRQCQFVWELSRDVE
jgi:hypothetical protein